MQKPILRRNLLPLAFIRTFCSLKLNTAFLHTHQGSKFRNEKKRGYLPRPVRESEQRWAPVVKSFRRGIHNMGQRRFPATTAG